MGTFVNDFAEPPFTFGEEVVDVASLATRTLVSSKYEESMSLVETMLEKLIGTDGDSGYLGDMNSALTEYSTVPISAITVTVPSVSVDTSARPVPTVGSLDTDFPEFTTSAPTLASIPTVDLSELVVPEMPSDLISTISWTESLYDTELFTDLLTRLQDYLTEGSTGLDATVEAAIYARESSRQDVIEAAQEEEVLDYFSTRGFELPTGPLAGKLQELVNEKARNRTNLSSEITKQQGELAQNNSQFVVTASIQLETVLRDSHNKVNDRSLDYSKAVVGFAIQVFAANIQKRIAVIEANKNYAELLIANLRAHVEYNNGLVSNFAAEAQAFGIIVDAKGKKNEALIEIFRAEVLGYNAETSALSEAQRNVIEKYRLQIANEELNLRADIANADQYIRSYEAESGLKVTISKSLSELASQSLASALGSVNMTASLGHQTGVAKQESFSHNESRGVSYNRQVGLDETHYFEEEAS